MNRLLIVTLTFGFQAWSLFSAGSTAAVPIVLAVGFALRLAFRNTVFKGRVWLWVSTAIAVILSIVCYQFTTPPPEGLVYVAYILPRVATLILGGASLFFQMLLFFTVHPFDDSNEEPLPLLFPVLFLVTSVCGMNQSISTSQNMTFVMYSMLVALGASVLSTSTTNYGAGWSEGGSRRLVLTSLFLLTAFFGMVTVNAWATSVAALQARLPGLVSEAFNDRESVRSYVRSGHLNSIAVENRTNSDVVALRITADRTPGYLRGKVFDLFRGSRWFDSNRRRRGVYENLSQRRPIKTKPIGVLAKSPPFATFLIEEPTHRRMMVGIEIQNDPQRGPTYFNQLGTNYVVAKSNGISLDAHGSIHSGIDPRATYTVYVSTVSKSQLPESQRERYLSELEGLDPKIRGLASEVFGSAATTKQKIEAVVRHFNQNYEYSLDHSPPEGSDPLSHFLLEKPAAHCEYFASGAVALLRYADVPCRYVTGYVAFEMDDDQEYWLARNKHAHAWVEAYDDQQQQWITVEPTPELYDIEESATEEELAAGGLSTTDGNFSQSSAEAFLRSWIYSHPLVERLWNAILALAAVLMGLVLYRRLRPSTPRGDLTMLRRTERRLLKWKLKRSHYETLHQFSKRVHTFAREQPPADAETIARAADWILSYAESRYACKNANASPA